MPDNSGSVARKAQLWKGRPRDPRLWPKVPFRIEEWGKSERVLQRPDGSIVLVRGPKPGGALASFIGVKTKHPLGFDPGVTRQVLVDDYAYSEEDANNRIHAFVRKKLAERVGKARQRAIKRS